ncbi:3-isopropylmalate dehydratase small subunit [Candidatus Collinsella stercoripullorum]|uniref:3-isopropylmalate dehydratase small subunit n=1 Tax=Candidatus Collinsella stercoripullorum TaxID=2838522 RepID=UPI0022E60B46|nr:3-isopropylmalate dehydratase small subunit [Candidatus Collinsella stercoripullorum]
MNFEGTVFRYGRDVDTDVIIPARYLNSSDHAHLSAHAMEDIDPTFAERVQPGDIIVAEENFGCGSSREHAPVAIKAAGVSCVIAKSFARIFYRNAINVGLPIMECPSAVDAIADGARVAVDTDTGTIANLDTGETFTAEPFPPFIAEIIEAGGLVERTRRKLAAESGR